MRIGVVVPVPAARGERERWERLAHRYIPLAHARAQAALGHEVHVFFDGPAERLEPAPGVVVHVSSGWLPPLRGALRSPHLVQAALRVRPDVLHLHHLLALENLAWAARAHPRVFAEYNGGAPPRSAVKRRALRAVSRRLAGAFFPAAAFCERLARAGAWSRGVPTHVSPETTARFCRCSARPATEPGAPRVLVVGRAEAPKAPLQTIEVLAEVLARAPGARFRWACPGGAELPAVEQALRGRPELAGRLERGPIPFERMAATYAWADVLIANSEREIGGTVLSEAFCQGTPVAAFSLPTFEALAGGSPAARLVGPRAPAELAQAALELAARPALRAEARARFEQHLSFEAIARARAAIYGAPVPP